MIDDDLDERREFIAHDWVDDGAREVGGERQRCSRCGTLSHWPGARESCSVVLARCAMQSPHTTPIHADQYGGPYVDGREPQCAICDRRYRKPARHGNGRACSPQCSQQHRREYFAERRRAVRAAKGATT